MPGTMTPLYILDAPQAFHRSGGPYQDSDGLDYPDNPQRFGLLSQVAALLCGPDSPLDWRPTYCIAMTGKRVWRLPIYASMTMPYQP